MEWIQTRDPHRRCPKWIPKSYADDTKVADELGKKAESAEFAFRDGKRKRAKPAKLKSLKSVAAKAWAAMEKARKLAEAKGVYIIRDATGFVVMRNATGSKRHGTHAKLEAAQAAAAKLLK